MRLIDADALANALFEKRKNYPQWVADTIGNMPTVDAYAMLKEQETVKPQLSISGMWYECPICHRHLTKDMDNYCARCGRELKWK